MFGVLAITTLVACSGGGGGGASGGTLPLTSGNADVAAKAAYTAGAGLLQAGSSGGVFTARVPGGGAPLQVDLADFARDMLLRVVPHPGVGRAIITETTPYGDGELVTVWNDADDNEELSTGDSFELTFLGATDDEGTRIDGRLVIDQIVLTVNQQAQTASMGARMTFDSLTFTDGSEALVFDGVLALSLSLGGDTMTFRYSISAVFQGAGNTVLAGTWVEFRTDLDTGAWTVTSSGGVGVVPLDASVTFMTTTPFTGESGEAYPSSGTMLIRGSGGSACRLVALSSTEARIDVDADGDGTFETTVTTQWSVLVEE